MQNIKHGLSSTRFYRIYRGVISRGNNKNLKNKFFKNYKNISSEWKNFEDFKNDMYESYLKHCVEFGEKQTTIDRINNNGNYNKENCRWATIKEQNNNRKNTRYYKKILLKDITIILGIKYNTVIYRIKRGWSIEKAIFTPVTTGLKYKGVDYN